METKPSKIKKMVAFYNMVANLIWSALNLVPISVFWYGHMNSSIFYVLLAASFLTLFLPKGFFNGIQLSKTTSVYKKIGVTFINRFTQNGDIINRMVRRKFPQYRIIYNRGMSVDELLRQTYIFEAFHFAMFTFFTFTTVYAFVLHNVWWGLIISVTNIIYNVYPNFLQQYIRLRLLSFRK